MTDLAKDLWNDLVDKKLWPVAVLLVVAMVAAPMVLARGGGSEAAPLPPAPVPAAEPAADPQAPDAAQARVVSLDEGPATSAPKGDYHDPFAKALAAAEAANKADSAPASVSVPSGSSSDEGAQVATGGSSGGTSEPSVPATVDTPPVDSTPDIDVTPTVPVADAGYFAGYKTTIHWGVAGSAKRVADVTRLAPLHAGSTPLLIFLGTRSEGKRALFAVVRDAATVGDGRCLPSGRDCQVIELRKGQAQFFDVTDADGAVTQFELDVDRIAERRADTRAWARAYRKTASKTGKRVLEDLADAGQDYATVFDYVAKDASLVRDVPATVAWASAQG